MILFGVTILLTAVVLWCMILRTLITHKLLKVLLSFTMLVPTAMALLTYMRRF